MTSSTLALLEGKTDSSKKDQINTFCCEFRMRSQLNWVQKGRILYGNETDVNEYPWQVFISLLNQSTTSKTNQIYVQENDLRRNTRCRCGSTEVTSAEEH